MAHMNQEMKANIREELKKVIPKSWKWSLRVDNYMSIALTISAAPIDLISKNLYVIRCRAIDNSNYKTVDKNLSINPYHLNDMYDGELLKIFTDILVALKSEGWYNNSDSQSDYFDIAYYFDINIGRWDKDFKVIE